MTRVGPAQRIRRPEQLQRNFGSIEEPSLRLAQCWVYDLSMADDKANQEVLNATRQLIDALRDAQKALGHLIEGVSEARARTERGVPIDQVLRDSELDAYRQVVDEGIEQFEVWRRIARGSAIRAAVAAGMTLTEIAEEFGFSRTYARRLAREAPPPPQS
jgi:hypothetical protein